MVGISILAALGACTFVTRHEREEAHDKDEDGDAKDGYGGADCDDEDPDVSSSKEEACGDDKDNDCDGATNEGCDCALTDGHWILTLRSRDDGCLEEELRLSARVDCDDPNSDRFDLDIFSGSRMWSSGGCTFADRDFECSLRIADDGEIGLELTGSSDGNHDDADGAWLVRDEEGDVPCSGDFTMEVGQIPDTGDPDDSGGQDTGDSSMARFSRDLLSATVSRAWDAVRALF